jgi:hypothetical protein
VTDTSQVSRLQYFVVQHFEHGITSRFPTAGAVGLQR